jgi:deoxyribodipyrimidine photo-lyase
VAFDAGLVWFRRDLRVADHAALTRALAQCRRVHCLFVYDRGILDPLIAVGQRADRRVEFIHAAVAALDESLRARGGALAISHGPAADAVLDLARRLNVDAVFANADYEPYATARDGEVARRLVEQGRRLVLTKDHVIFEKDEILTRTGTPYAVFTPYRNAWLARLTDAAVAPRTADLSALAPAAGPPLLPSLEQLGFQPTNLRTLGIPLGEAGAQRALDDFAGRIGQYGVDRDYPARQATSGLSMHLRFGTAGVRALARCARKASTDGASTWLSELVWRDFFQMILWHHPHVVERAFRPQYDRIRWESGARADEHFAAWCEGRTGIPIVDAGMRQLNATGMMHNRVRMITASFLVKHLGIDWRRGEQVFARALNDFELASNNGNWQWVASTGCDAQPWFRIFNPVAQSKKFDPAGEFIRRHVPELANVPARDIHAPWLAAASVQRAAGCVVGVDYPRPIIDLAAARAQALARYAVVRDGARSA